MAYPYDFTPKASTGQRKPRSFDPYTGLAQSRGAPYISTPKETIHALGLDPKHVRLNPITRGHSRAALAISQAFYRRGYAPRIYTFPGFGALPLCPITQQPYLPTPDDPAPRWQIEAETGMREREPAEIGETFTYKGRVINRAQATAATALGLHPLSPVMAWYIEDPKIYGYGIHNLYTPELAGLYRVTPGSCTEWPTDHDGYNLPPAPDRFNNHPVNLFTFTQHYMLDPADWPLPEPPHRYTWQETEK